MKKISNLILSRLSIFLGKTRLPYFPSKITIESGNVCNLRCPLCPTGQHDNSAKKGFISFELYKKILDEIGGYLRLIRLYNWGEPLLNKELLPMILYARQYGVEVKISTNLSLKLDDTDITELLQSGLKILYISCNGASKDTYLKYHVGGDFGLVIDNMKRLVQKKKEMTGCRTKLVWLFHVFKHNEHEIAEAQKMAKEIGIKIKRNKMRPDMGKEIFETTQSALERDAEWIPENRKFLVYPGKKKKRIACTLPWTETVINWDGTVLPCCAVYSETFAFGNIQKESFAQIWNNEMYISARKEILGKKNKKNTICHICKSTGYLHSF
ncbi:MAG: radical SAM protein [Candidatus Kuenenia sp.]|nr:radical SAM protein [Candidatus Kuenenia hertensis]